jgi:hypothetical protein
MRELYAYTIMQTLYICVRVLLCCLVQRTRICVADSGSDAEGGEGAPKPKRSKFVLDDEETDDSDTEMNDEEMEKAMLAAQRQRLGKAMVSCALRFRSYATCGTAGVPNFWTHLENIMVL